MFDPKGTIVGGFNNSNNKIQHCCDLRKIKEEIRNLKPQLEKVVQELNNIQTQGIINHKKKIQQIS